MVPVERFSNDELARVVGLNDWRVGVHRRHSPSDASIIEEWAHTLWLVECLPSFHDSWLLGAVLVGPWDGGPADEKCWRKAVLAQSGEAAVISLGDDPVADALNRVEMLPTNNYESLDGIAYRVAVQSVALCGTFSFGNPAVPSLKALEHQLFCLAERIAAAIGEEWSREVLRTWRQYGVRHSRP
jgi:hypothetical protein